MDPMGLLVWAQAGRPGGYGGPPREEAVGAPGLGSS